jgi:hypothetical protein
MKSMIAAAIFLLTGCTHNRPAPAASDQPVSHLDGIFSTPNVGDDRYPSYIMYEFHDRGRVSEYHGITECGYSLNNYLQTKNYRYESGVLTVEYGPGPIKINIYRDRLDFDTEIGKVTWKRCNNNQ